MTGTDDLASAERLIEALCRNRSFPHPVTSVQLIETHISWILLTGEHAYKIKKPVSLGFVDFSSLERRHSACQEELRLNRRLAPDLYLGLLPITGSPEHPSIGGSGPPIEYAVQMRQFPQDDVLTAQLDAGRITGNDMECLAKRIAAFHQALALAGPDSAWGSLAAVQGPIVQSIAQIRATSPDAATAGLLEDARVFLDAQLAALGPGIAARRTAGRVRECHGDLHLGNLVRTGAGITAFDALEFDPALRWIDVANEIAFLVMDLLVHRRSDLAMAFLNRYLAQSGDYDSLRVMPLYLAYRALVRAKVALLSPPGDREHAGAVRHSVQELLAFAAAPLASLPRLLIVTCGVSGSGKTWLARRLAQALPVLHIRSDVERKRLAGLDAGESSGSPPGGGIYTAAASVATYERLREIAGTALDAGFGIIVDATHLSRRDREATLALAKRYRAPSAILYCHGDPSVLGGRLRDRRACGQDASEADAGILQRQLDAIEPPLPTEAGKVIEIDATGGLDADAVAARLRTLG